MQDYQGYFASLGYGFSALVLLVVALRWFDILAGGWNHFRREGGPLQIIHRDSRACALYYGLRFLGAAVLVGFVLSSIRLGF